MLVCTGRLADLRHGLSTHPPGAWKSTPPEFCCDPDPGTVSMMAADAFIPIVLLCSVIRFGGTVLGRHRTDCVTARRLPPGGSLFLLPQRIPRGRRWVGHRHPPLLILQSGDGDLVGLLLVGALDHVFPRRVLLWLALACVKMLALHPGGGTTGRERVLMSDRGSGQPLARVRCTARPDDF